MAEKRKSLLRLTHDEIEAYILDPENNTLPEAQLEQFNRVMSAARLYFNSILVRLKLTIAFSKSETFSFQFYISAIKASVRLAIGTSRRYFNSILVRLKPSGEEPSEMVYLISILY